MGYTFTCDHCERRYDHEPPLMASFNETFIKTADSWLAQEFGIGETVTFCRPCSEELIA